MAVYPNGRYMTQSPGRHFGPAPGLDNYARDRGDRLNIYLNEYWNKVLGGMPSGYEMTGTVPPLQSGALATFIEDAIKITPNAQGTLGLPGQADASFLISTGVVDGQLVVSGSGSLSFVFTLTGDIAAALFGTGSTSFTFSAGTATISALGWMDGTLTLTITPQALTPYGIGHMEGSIVPYTELSPQSLASAVWQSIASDYNEAGTMGEKMNGAGSAGNPWTEVIESGLTAAQIQRLLLSILTGKTEIIPGVGGAATVKFKSVDGTVDRIIAEMTGSARTGITIDGN